MKKLLLSALAVCVFTFSNAQEIPKKVNGLDITFGVKAGLNLSTLYGDVHNASTKPGFHFGAMAELELTDKISLQPEVLYSLQGARIDGGAGSDYDLHLSYITFPVIGKYYVAEGLSLEAGPQIGILINSKSKAGGESINEKKNTSSIDFGANIGAGYKMDSGLNFALRYSLGLLNAYDGPGSSGNNITNATLQLSVGYFLN